MDGSLSYFLSERTVDELFIVIEREQAKIRTDYKVIGNNVAAKVFDYYSKKNYRTKTSTSILLIYNSLQL